MIPRSLWHLVYPELDQIPETERKEAFRRAGLCDFDGIELAGMAFGLIATSALTRYAVAPTAVGYVLEFLASLFLAVPLLAVLLGPFLVRRTRRGLRQYSRRHLFHEEVHS